MSLLERIDADFMREFKAKNAAAVSTLRLLKAALKNEAIEKMKPLEEAEAVAVVKRELKKLKDGLDSFVAGKRDDLAAQARQEVALLEQYLPPELGEAEIRAAVDKVVVEMGAVTQKDFGKVMGQVMKATGPSADGAKVSAAVKAALAGK
ncbi:GatB/YqeY domain-containing protein [Candidatus Uhrbacteria bacterium]|nr:GatB/YqeY domain-containing protein [Candidatus Uhrbacteria bacterium]